MVPWDTGTRYVKTGCSAKLLLLNCDKARGHHGKNKHNALHTKDCFYTHTAYLLHTLVLSWCYQIVWEMIFLKATLGGVPNHFIYFTGPVYTNLPAALTIKTCFTDKFIWCKTDNAFHLPIEGGPPYVQETRKPVNTEPMTALISKPYH